MTKAPKSKETFWSAPYVILMAVNVFQSMAAFMANTTIPVYANHLGASTAMVGIAVSSFAVTALLVRPFAGPAFDSFSKKRLLLVTQAIICISLFLYTIIDSLPALIAVRLFHGIGIGCGGPLAMSLVSEFVPASKFASGISVYSLAQSFAQVIGPAVGLYLVESIGFSHTYLIASGCLLVAMCGILLVKEPQRERLPYEFKPNRMFAREALDKALVIMLLAIAYACISSYLVLYAYELGIEGVGMYFTVYAACLLVTRPLFGRLADNLGSPRVIIVGCVCFVVSFVILANAHGLPALLASAVIGSAGFGSCSPLVQTLALASVPVKRRGAASNTSFTGLDLGMLIGPVIGGNVTELLVPMTGGLASAYSAMWLFMLVPVAIAFAIVVFWRVKERRT